MTTATLTHETELKEADFRLSSLDKLAERIRDEALTQAREKLQARYHDLDPARLLLQADFFDYFKYGLACGVAEALAVNDTQVQVVYTYDPALNPGSESGEERPLDTMLHLLVVVKKPSAALEAFVAALDRALTTVLQALPAAPFAQCESVLDVSVITDRDIRLGLGYAAMLSSIFAPPLKVWQRQA